LILLGTRGEIYRMLGEVADENRYFKTTLYGLSGCAPDYVMLMVGGNAGLIGMSKVCLEPYCSSSTLISCIGAFRCGIGLECPHSCLCD